MTQMVLLVLMVLFPLSEIGLALRRRARAQDSAGADQGSLRLLWLSIGTGLCLAVAAQWLPGFQVPVARNLIRLAALVLLLGGLVLRWAAILTLGRFFTVDVAILENHTVHQSGLYRAVRHPSYTGLLLAFLGLGLSFANWLSLVVLLLPITLAVLNRVVKEEAALLRSLGAAYGTYCARTKRFIPGVF